MYSLDKLAPHLVAEIPVSRLALLLKDDPGEALQSVDGIFCGGNCARKDGMICGGRCNPQQDAPDVVDRSGQLELTANDLSDIRANLATLRRAVLQQVELHLGRLR